MKKVGRQKHVLTMLRRILGMKQSAFASLVGCSTATIQSIEPIKSRMTLSEDLAKRTAQETGVDVGWLLKNDPTAQPVTNWGDPYTIAEFDLHRARLVGPKIQSGHFARCQERLIGYLDRVADLLVAAHDNDQIGLASYKLDSALERIEGDLGLSWNGVGTPCPPRSEVPDLNLEQMRPVFSDRAAEILDKFNAILFLQFRKKYPRNRHVAIKFMSGEFVIIE
jgi:transcriptional regulator with XRE-family HTH domain